MPHSKVPTVFVCSATGYQGGALSRQLLALGWNVHATTRNLNSPAAKALTQLGAELTEGDWDDIETLSASIAGCDKLYLCLLPNWNDPNCERRQCKSILDIAKKAGVQQVVSSTTLGVSQLDDGVRVAKGSFMERHMMSKKAIEQSVVDAGFKYHTLLRPGFFMANFLEPKIQRYAEIRDSHSWTTSMTAKTQLPIIDHVDIGRFATRAFQDPEGFHGRIIGLASDELGIQEMLDEVGRAAGFSDGTIRACFMTDEEIEAQANMSGFSNSHKALRDAYLYVNMDELRSLVPVTSFRDFLEREKEAVQKTYH